MAFKIKKFTQASPLKMPDPINPKQSVMSGSPEYRKAVKEGTFADVPNQLDEIVIYAGNNYKRQPNFNSLTKEERQLSKTKGPIGRALRQKARGEKPSKLSTTDFVKGLASGVGSMIQAPQSLAVEGIEALRGNEYSFKNALNPIVGNGGKQRLPSETMGFKDKPGWDLGGSLNTMMDVVADPSNLVGAGVLSKTYKGAKNIPKAIKNAPKLGDQATSSIKKFFSPDQNLSGVSDIGAKLSKPNPDNASKMGFFNNVTGRNKKAVSEIEPLIRELAKEGPNYKKVISETVTNMNSAQGMKRLEDEAIAYAKLRNKPTNKKAINKDVKKTISTIKNSTSANIDAFNAIKKDGSLSRNKAMKAIYGTEKTSRGKSKKLSSAGGTLINNGQARETTSHIGANIVGKAPAKHEIGHMIKNNKYNPTGQGSPMDIELRSIKQIPDEFLNETQRQGKRYFNKVTPAQGGRYSFPRPALDPEPSSFAQELRQQMLSDNFITNKKGTWSDFTPEILNRANKFYKKNPRGSVTTKQDGSKGSFFSTTRLLDFADPKDYKKLAKSMNKLTGAIVPVAAGAGYLNSNKKK